MFKVSVIILFVCLSRTVVAQYYPYSKDLVANGNFILRWDYDDTRIRFELEVATTGWVGFGISRDARMTPADVAIGYVKEGQVFLGDFHTTGYVLPTLDTSQDLVLEGGEEVNGKTIIRFNRLLDTCDAGGDRPITTDTTRIVFAYHTADPVSWTNFFRHSFRNTATVQLLARVRPVPPPSDVIVKDFRAEQFPIPSDTVISSRCYAFDMSELQTKHHIIKAEAVYSPGDRAHVHAMYLYRCSANTVPAQQGGFDCNDERLRYCRGFVANFDFGVNEINMPEGIGIPIGGPGEANMYVLANFYENYDLTSGMVSNSGVRLTYTPTLQRVDGAFMTVGSLVGRNWVQFLPPGEENFEQTATCSSECLKWGTSPSASNGPLSTLPMSIIGVMFQANRLAKAMKLRHYREASAGPLEQPWIASDDTYSSNSRGLRFLSVPRRIRNGESLKLECTYDTRNAQNPTYGGWGTENELCRAYVLYYPPKPIDLCVSWNQYDTMVDENNARVLPENVFQTLMAVDWQSAAGTTMKENLKQSLKTSSVTTQCWSTKQSPAYAFDFTRPATPQVVFSKEPPRCPGPA